MAGKGQGDEAGFWLWMGRLAKVGGVLGGIFATISFFTNPNNAPVISGTLVPFNAAFQWLEVNLPGVWGEVVVTALKVAPAVGAAVLGAMFNATIARKIGQTTYWKRISAYTPRTRP